MNSCQTTGLYEAGAPIWGIDTKRKQYKGFKCEDPSWPQLSVAESFFSADALLQSLHSSGHHPRSGGVMAVVERYAREAPACGGLRGWPACGGLVVIWALWARLDEALEKNDDTMILKLYEASLTATVRVRIDPGLEQLILDSIHSNETLRVLNLSAATDSFWSLVRDLTGLAGFEEASGGPGGLAAGGGGGKQMLAYLNTMGIRWKGRACDRNLAFAVLAIAPFTLSEALHNAVKALEDVTMKFSSDWTILMRVCQAMKAETPGADEKLAKMKVFVEDLHVQLLCGHLAARGAGLTQEVVSGTKTDKAARVGPSLAPGSWGIGDGRGG